jgi:PAS domain S-box-containing protein
VQATILAAASECVDLIASASSDVTPGASLIGAVVAENIKKSGGLAMAVVELLSEAPARVSSTITEGNRDCLASILEFSEDGFVAVDRAGQIMTWNVTAQRIFGRGADGLVGVPLSQLLDGQGGQEFERSLRLVWQGRVERYESTATVDGKSIPIAVTVSPIRDRCGFLSGASVTIRDITSYRQRAQFVALQNTDVSTRLVAAVSHDFNNLLCVIAGYGAQALDRVPEGDPLHDEIRQIVKASARAISLNRHLLSVSHERLLNLGSWTSTRLSST